jgi:hypothetical protein
MKILNHFRVAAAFLKVFEGCTDQVKDEVKPAAKVLMGPVGDLAKNLGNIPYDQFYEALPKCWGLLPGDEDELNARRDALLNHPIMYKKTLIEKGGKLYGDFIISIYSMDNINKLNSYVSPIVDLIALNVSMSQVRDKVRKFDELMASADFHPEVPIRLSLPHEGKHQKSLVKAGSLSKMRRLEGSLPVDLEDAYYRLLTYSTCEPKGFPKIIVRSPLNGLKGYTKKEVEKAEKIVWPHEWEGRQYLFVLRDFKSTPSFEFIPIVFEESIQNLDYLAGEPYKDLLASFVNEILALKGKNYDADRIKYRIYPSTYMQTLPHYFNMLMHVKMIVGGYDPGIVPSHKFIAHQRDSCDIVTLELLIGRSINPEILEIASRPAPIQPENFDLGKKKGKKSKKGKVFSNKPAADRLMKLALRKQKVKRSNRKNCWKGRLCN